MTADAKRQALEQLRQGLAFERDGRLGLARSHYQRAAKLDPNSADAWLALGRAALASGNAALAIKELRTSIKLRPAAADAHVALAAALRAAGRYAEAVASAGDAAALRPGDAEAAFQLGACLEQAGRIADAERAYRDALRRRSDHVDAMLALGGLLRGQGHAAEALPFFELARRVAPQRCDTHGECALGLAAAGRHLEAAECARAAVALAPRDARWWRTLGTALRTLHDIGGALNALRRALELDPNDAAAAFELALALDEAGDVEAARERLHTVKVPAESAERVHWLRALALPAIYRDDGEIDVARARFAEGLDALHARLTLKNATDVRAAVVAASSVAPFRLHYQPRDNTALQCRFGDLVARIMAAAAPALAEPCTWRPRAHGGRLRVGFVSSHLMQHTVARYFSAMITGLPAGRFDVRVWYPAGALDASTQAIAGAVGTFTQARRDPLALAAAIRAAELDALVYLEIGMDPLHQALAGLRLAPVQCVLYGHPATSGAPAIDCFLGADALEPPSAQAHYRERLVRLPGLGTRPSLPPAPGDGAWYETQERPLLLCLQNVIKLTPEFDCALARIAAETGACIGFFARNPPLMQRFAARIGAAFAAQGLDRERHLKFLPAYRHADYLAGVARAPFVLDSPWFSGGATSLDALGVGTPVLAWDGPMARGRQTPAMLRMLGAGELVAADHDDYVGKAVALWRDRTRREELRASIEARRTLLFEDDAAIAAFADFLERGA